MTSKSKSGTMTKSWSKSSSIWRCCAVTQTMSSMSGCARSACTTGAILIVSGRVPNTVITRSFRSLTLECVLEGVGELARKRERDDAQHEANRVDQQHGLANVESEAEDQLMMKMTAIRLSDATARTRPAHDRGERIEDR